MSIPHSLFTAGYTATMPHPHDDGMHWPHAGPCQDMVTKKEPSVVEKEQPEPFPYGSTEDELSEVLDQALELARGKDEAYGQAWIGQGYMGNLARVLSKAERLRNMMWCDSPEGTEALHPVEAEGAEDTLLDLINIAAFALVNLRNGNRWGRP